MNDENRLIEWFYQKRFLIIVIVAALVVGAGGFMWWYLTTTTKVSTKQTSVVIKMKEDLNYNVMIKGPTVNQIKEAELILKEYKAKLGIETDSVKRKALIGDVKFIFADYEQGYISESSLAMFLKDIRNGQIE